jgi:ketosteroid isomerase-like protein
MELNRRVGPPANRCPRLTEEITMTDHPNVKLAESTWEAVCRSDVASLRHKWGSELVWHVRDGSPWNGDLVGADDILDYLADMGESADDYTIRLDDIIANDHHVILLSHVSALRGEHRLDVSYVLIGKIAINRVTEIWTMPLDSGSVADFWSRPDDFLEPSAAALLDRARPEH